jgi:hypothetical protein
MQATAQRRFRLNRFWRFVVSNATSLMFAQAGYFPLERFDLLDHLGMERWRALRNIRWASKRKRRLDRANG